MSKRRGRTSKRSRQRPRPGIVLVFGESQNDRRAIVELIQALCPELESRVQERRRPLFLTRGMNLKKVLGRAQQIAKTVELEKIQRPVLCVFIHEDCDCLEPSHEERAERIESAMASVGVRVFGVVPAWEIEAWWFLWPKITASISSQWKPPTAYQNKEVGKVTNAKETLAKSLSQGPRSQRSREYRESDSPEIARRVRQAGLARNPQARSMSYDRFSHSVDDCCRDLESNSHGG
jgi:hypothetical protein